MVRRREEEYLEIIYLLSKEKGVIRVKDLASMLGVKPPSVVEYLNKLSNKGYITYEKGEYILLKEEGRKIAEEIYARHIAIKEFLIMLLGIPEDIAEEDACYIEHGLSKLTLDRIKKLVEYLKSNPEEIDKWISSIRSYLESK